MATRETAGTFGNGIRYLRIGAGPRPLVILTGMVLDNDPPGRLTAQAYRYGFRRLTTEHTVYVVSRRRGLPAGATGGHVAADLATAFAELGPVRLMGLSSGGFVAQHVALDHPGLVERLVLVVTGARLSPRGREICLHWRELAEAGRWRRLRGEMAAVAVDGRFGQRLAQAAGAVLSGGHRPDPADVADFRTVVDADLAHDTEPRLPTLTVPTLVVGGQHDPFFPEPVLRATAAALPHSTLRVYPGAGHGLPKQHGRRLQDDVHGFLATATKS